MNELTIVNQPFLPKLYARNNNKIINRDQGSVP